MNFFKHQKSEKNEYLFEWDWVRLDKDFKLENMIIPQIRLDYMFWILD